MLQRYCVLLTVLLALMLTNISAISASSLVDRPLTIAVNKTSYPYHYLGEDDKAEGLTVDLWKRWAEIQGVEIQFKVMTWPETLAELENGDVDIHAGLLKTNKREQLYSFTSPFFFQKSHIFIHRDYNIRRVSEVLPLTLGIVANSSHFDVINELYPEFSVKLYENRFALFDAALKGEIVAFTNLDTISSNYPRHRQLSQMFPAYKRLLFEKSEYTSAVAKNNKPLLAFIEQGLKKISLEERSKIEKKWLGIDKKSDTLALMFSPEFPPLMALSPAGKPQGLFIDMWKSWSEHTGQAIEFIPQSIENAVEMISTGGADIYVGYPKMTWIQSPQTIESKLAPAHQVYKVDISCYVSERSENISDLSMLIGRKIGIYRSLPHLDNLKKYFPDNELVFYQSFQAMIADAENGTIEAMIGVKDILDARLHKANLHANFYRLADVKIELDVFAMTEKDNQTLAQIIRDGFSLIPDEELINIERRWLPPDSEGYFRLNKQKATLTNTEKEWIETQEVIRLGVNKNWAPVEFIDENGQMQGINAEINALVQQRTGLKFTYVPFDNWNSLFNALMRSEIDALGSATETDARKISLLFSNSYWDMPWVVIHQKQRGSKLKIQDFYGGEVAIVKGYHLIEKVRNEHPNITLRTVDSHEEGLLAVQQGVVDGFIENIASASELIRRDSLITLSMSAIEEFNVDTNSFAIRKDWPELQSIINKGLATISATERKKIYEKWFDIRVETGLDRNVVLRVSLQIGAIIIIIIVVIVLWNRRLYVEIKTRKALEEKMKHMATHDELTGLPNRVLLKDRINHAINYHVRQDRLMAVLFIDLDGFKTINDTYGHDIGDELLVLVAERLAGCIRKSDTVVRFGGDEFVLLLTGLHNRDEAAFIAEKVLKLVQQPFPLSIGQENIGCSIGIAMFPFDGETESDLLKVADTLMYRVKAAGKNHYVFNSDK